jgi:hypothetical protein
VGGVEGHTVILDPERGPSMRFMSPAEPAPTR